MAAPHGGNITLVCDVCMSPEGHIVWQREGKPITANHSLSEDARNITVWSLTDEDFGNYTCLVTNSIFGDNITKQFNISVRKESPPQRPVDFKVTASTSFSVNVSWLPGDDGGSRQTFNLSYKVVGEDFKHWSTYPDLGPGVQLTESITGLDNSTQYEFKVISRNQNPSGDTIGEPSLVYASTKG